MAWDGIERRRENRMANSFQPSNGFEGYVKASLENLKEQFDKLPCDEHAKKVQKVEIELANIKGKATILGAIAGFVMGFLTRLFWMHKSP